MDYEKIKAELLPLFVDYLLDNCTIKITPSGTLYVNDEKILIKDVTNWMLTFCRNDATKKFIPLLTESPSSNIFLETLKIEIKRMQSAHRMSVYKGADDVIKGFSYDGLVPFISVENHNKIIFFDKKSKQITNLSYDTYSQTVDKEYKIRPMPAKIEFNPYRPEQIYMGEYIGQDCTHINTYRKPEWQIGKKLSNEEAKKLSKLPNIIDDFFTHLFPDQNCREFVYDWLHFALASRCETYLVMNGAKGVGKNVLSNIVCASLVGKNNHKIAHKGALDKFTVILAECRMIVFDEFKIVDDESINTLKRYANSDQMIERKGIDVGQTEETYNSYIICNNAVTDMRIEWDDRRFSVVDLTDKKLEDAWSEDKIATLLELIQDPTCDEMRSFGYWLLYRSPKVMTSAFSVYKGDHFYKLCYTSFPEWAKMIIDEITSKTTKNYYDEGELKMMFKDRTNGVHRFPNMAKVEDFLKNYKHNGENLLGHIEKDERTYYLQVNEVFVKSTKDNTGIDWQDNLL
jgi:hypothetical protein